ncbi:hypothetical protein ACU4GD_23705 [Cupriavidus basilensis]
MLTAIPCTDEQAPAQSLGAMLESRYAGFAGWLRANGFGITSSEMAAAMEVAQRMGQMDSQLLRWSLRALLCSRAEEWRRFDELFDAYFLRPNRRALGAGPCRRRWPHDAAARGRPA